MTADLGARSIDGAIELLHGTEPVATYAWAAGRRPFVHPLSTRAGHVLTRDAPEDHPWHHGLWFTIKFVNGENFWEEHDRYGVLRHTGEPCHELSTSGADPALDLDGSLRWIRPDRETVVIHEHRRLSLVSLHVDDAYAIDFHTELTPVVDVELDRTPFTTWGGYGGLAFRGRADFHDTRLLLSGRGATGLDRVLGDRADWLDLSGVVGGDDGDAPAGITILDAPTNPNHPVPWYASTRAATYGDQGWSNFLNPAFLWDRPLSVPASATVTFDYRIVVHDGIWDEHRCAKAYEAWVGSG